MSAPQPTSPIRVLVADDDELLCSLLCSWLEREPGLEVIGVASDGRQALDRARELCPDILLMDVRMPELSGLEVLENLRSDPAPPGVLIFSATGDEAAMLAAFRAGARGFVSKRAAEQHLINALRAVAGGESWIDRRLARRLVEELAYLSRRVSELERPDAALSEREREVLRCLGRGLTNAQIGKELFLSPNTVKIHVSNILHKLELPNRTEAALFVVRTGLMPIGEA